MADNDIALMAHLMRRAGFGAPYEALQAWAAKGYEAAVEELLHPENQPDGIDMLELFSKMYSPLVGRSLVKEYMSQTGSDALGGADILSTAPQKYASTVTYGSNTVAQYMRNIAQVHLAELARKSWTPMPRCGSSGPEPRS